MLRVLKILLMLVVLLVGAGFAAIWYVGAWNILFPSNAHDSVAPPLPVTLGSPAILVFSKTNQFRHKDGIAGGHVALGEIAAQNGWDSFHTENGAVFNSTDLTNFDAVVFLNATGDMLSQDQRTAMRHWIEGGGGWLGIHAAGDGSHAGWPWYMEHLIGAQFTAHIMGPQFQIATITIDNPDHPALAGLPNLWDHEEEWYSWEASPRSNGFTILATVDEDSYTPEINWMGQHVNLRMGDHPVVWSNCVGMGRSLYTAMGHRGEAFEEPNFRLLLKNGLNWLMGQPTDGC